MLFTSATFINAQETETSILSFPNPIEYDGTEFYIIQSKQRSKTLFQEQYIPDRKSVV